MPIYRISTPSHVHPGGVEIRYQGEAVCEISLIPTRVVDAAPENDFETRLRAQFDAYLEDANFRFDLPLRLRGTDYQQRVWEALRRIPAGEVRSYGELAHLLASSPRAVGNACRRNPVPIIVPCHRVVARTGIGGFGGAVQGELVEQKRRLLRHEGLRF